MLRGPQRLCSLLVEQLISTSSGVVRVLFRPIDAEPRSYGRMRAPELDLFGLGVAGMTTRTAGREGARH